MHFVETFFKLKKHLGAVKNDNIEKHCPLPLFYAFKLNIYTFRFYLFRINKLLSIFFTNK